MSGVETRSDRLRLSCQLRSSSSPKAVIGVCRSWRMAIASSTIACMAFSSCTRFFRLSILALATSEAIRETPVKNSIRWPCRSAQAVRRGNHRGDVETAVLAELDAVQPAEGGRNLVLGADIFLNDLLLDMNGLAGQLVLRHVLAAQSTDRMQQPDRERRAGAEAGAGWEVAVMMDFQSFLDLQPVEHGARRRVLDFGGLADIFYMRIDDPVLVLEKRRQVPAGDIAVLVDGGGQHHSTMFEIPGRVIGAAPEK